ncbi:hypothetical protein [Catellatospora paridis]|uniref:hypothetical protein n=1 Tax=Catellatospora paridis TaxID=1617086 RepID=UPI0012D49248|nr:hypothetical protein [Catellatospora paridis]
MALNQLSAPETADVGAAGLRSAANDLRVIGSDATPAKRQSFAQAAAALDWAAGAGLADHESGDELSRALQQLGEEVQGACQFPLG